MTLCHTIPIMIINAGLVPYINSVRSPAVKPPVEPVADSTSNQSRFAATTTQGRGGNIDILV